MGLTEAVIDISEHQGNVDFGVCYDAGIRHVIIRAGINGRYDYKLDRNVRGFRAAGIGVPALYWFINPCSSVWADEQGRLAQAACDSYDVPMMMLDAEWYAGNGGSRPIIKGDQYRDWLRLFASKLRRPMMYTAPSFWNDYLRNPAGNLADCDDFAVMDTIIASFKWQARGNDPIAQGVHPTQWGNVVQAKSPPALPANWDGSLEGWQFSAGLNKQGSVYGMQSNDLDLNVVSDEALERWYGRHLDPDVDPVPPTPTPTPTPTPIPSSPEDDMKLITNNEPYPQFTEAANVGENPPDGSNWPVGWVVWGMMSDGTKRWIHGAEFAAYAAEPRTPLTTGQIQSIPGYSGPQTVTAVVDVEAIATRVRAKFREEPLS